MSDYVQPHRPEFLIPGPAILFAPAGRKEIIPKAAERADIVILDLEDGAGDVDRDIAYANISEANLNPATTWVRIVGPQDPHHGQDIEFVRSTPYRNIIVPKVGASLPPNLEDFNVLPIIETPPAVLNIAEIVAEPHVVGLYWGADDLTIELGGLYSRQRDDEPQPGAYRATMTFARVQTLYYAALHGKFAMDAVYQDFSDDEGLFAEATDSARMGFTLFPCIHPRQVATVRAAFAPTEAQLEWAKRVAEKAAKSDGAFTLDGQMVDTPLIKLAHKLLHQAPQAT